MTIAILVIIVLALVIGLGILIFALMKRSQAVVPESTDRRSAEKDQVVALDDQGGAVMESQDGPPEEPRDATGFESVLGEELKDLHPNDEV
jgi:hypothetical protein